MDRQKYSKNNKGPKTKPSKFKKQKQHKKNKTTILNDEITQLTERYKEIEVSNIENFVDFPLCGKTKKGLTNGKYEVPTAIQRQSIGLALQGHDILGAAKTGSGKTLAFLIPVLECLFVQKWTRLDGLGALIISPTRELAYQIFGVLRVVGKFHDFSAGLVIGGKHLWEEAEKINNTNVIICTPGRLLQHMDQTFNFNADNLQILVLDEADRILDMGFKDTMNAIIQNLPRKRQTLLFSATQTKSVKDLARLSLKDPMYVSVHENATHSTPTQLTQSYIVCDLHEKMDMLWSFIRNHLKMKTLVFLSSCKQVRFVYEAIRRMRPGVPVLCLHGAMQQMKRVAVYEGFKNKKHVVLLATDIAARGLDFPAVHWVIQLDCPEDANTYIHRVGRTARYEKNGEALLVLTPSEEEYMVKNLETKKIPIEKIQINKEKLKTIQGKLEALCASDVELKQFAQRGFVSYLKAVFFMKDKKVFDVTNLDTDSYARSLGLAVVPRIRFLEKKEKNRGAAELTVNSNVTDLSSKRIQHLIANPSSESDSDSQDESSSDSGSEDESKTSQNTAETVSKQQSKQNPVRTNTESNSNSDHDLLSENVSDSSEGESSSENDSPEDESPSESDLSDGDIAHTSKTVTEKNKVKKIQEKQNKAAKNSEVFSFGLDADDGDDLFTVKKDAGTLALEKDIGVELEKGSNKNKKSQTKAALAKKIMKKNLTVNEKIVFDEEGKEIINVLKKSQLKKEEEEENEGGIDISKAQQRMREEDAIDKQIFKERVKQKHKEERKKAKERKRKKTGEKTEEDEDEETVAMLGSGTESGAEWNSDDQAEASSGSEAGSMSSDEDESQSEESESEDDEPPVKKAKITRTSMKTNAFEPGQSLEDDEMMALHLLSGGL